MGRGERGVSWVGKWREVWLQSEKAGKVGSRSEWPVNSTGHLSASVMDCDWLINPSFSGRLYCERPCSIFSTHTMQTPTYMQTNMLINKPMEWAGMHVQSISSLDPRGQWIITLSVLSATPELWTTVTPESVQCHAKFRFQTTWFMSLD